MKFFRTCSFRERAFKQLPEAKIQLKLSKNLCFLWDEKFRIYHVCSNIQFHVLIIDCEVGKKTIKLSQKKKKIIVLKNLQLFMYNINGFTSKSIKLWGELAGNKVVVFIDCGASTTLSHPCRFKIENYRWSTCLHTHLR